MARDNRVDQLGDDFGDASRRAGEYSRYAARSPYDESVSDEAAARAARRAARAAGYGSAGARASRRQAGAPDVSEKPSARPSRRPSKATSQPDAYEQQGTSQPAYPVGAGVAYTAVPPEQRERPVGVNPVTGREYYERIRPKSLTRRQLLLGAVSGLVGVGALSVAGIGWWTHRAVACTVNGEQRKAPIGSTADEIIRRGFASPRPGNLVSISAEGEDPAVLEAGAGKPFTLLVNGEEVDVESYRLADGDELVFKNGGNLVEDVYEQVTEIPCGIQIPSEDLYLSTIGYVQQWGMNGRSVIETGVISGKSVDRGVVQEPQDLVIACGRINPADGRLLVALTFDDGPSPTYTPQYLDILAQYGVKATFFNLGINIEEGDDHRALCKRCVDEGHQMASHTYSHDDITLTGMSEDARNNEIKSTFDIIEQATGVKTNVVRPPFGELRGKGFLQYIAHAGDISYSAYWSVDSLDWELPGVDAIVSNCTKGLSGDNYNGAVILMHDGGGTRDQTVQALPQVISIFQNAGYEFVTMNELLAADPTYPSWVTDGYVTRPEGAVIPDITPYL